jgi:two-component system cell cycle response regulator
MEDKSEQKLDVFQHAWEIISRDNSIPPEEKKGILRLLRILIEISEASPRSQASDSQLRLQTHEVVSRHSLMALVKQQADELNALKNLSLNLTSSLDLQIVLEAVVAEALRLVKNARTAHIFLYSHGKLEFGASLDAKGVKNKPISMPRKNGLTYLIANSREKVIIEDMQRHPIYSHPSNEWTGSIIGVPLKFKDLIVGVMNLSRSTTGGFTRAELRLIELLADQAAVAISNATLHTLVAEQANTDILTGLPNRRALEDRLQEEIRYAKRMNLQFSVVMMDLDGFKLVNDQYGHIIGDQVLTAVASHLMTNLRPTDFLARYGGDEFTLLIREGGLETAETVTKKIVELVKRFDFSFPNRGKMELGITAGIAVYPIHALNAGDLLRAADSSLYQGKKHNRGTYSVAKGITGPLQSVALQKK